MFTYRITKYNPKYRNKKGAYTREEWTEFADIGRRFRGKLLTKTEYEKIENAYVTTLLSFLMESSISAMKINREQNFKKIKLRGRLIKRNQVYNLQDLKELFKLILREYCWCKFKNKDGSYIDFGGEYYVYIGVPKLCKKSILLAKRNKLFVEKYPEPVLD